MPQDYEDGDVEDNSEDYAEGDFTGDNDSDYDYLEWEDSLGNFHELQYGNPPEDGEERTGFLTFEEAEAYIKEIMTDVAQYFDVYYYDGDPFPYHVWWSGETD